MNKLDLTRGFLPITGTKVRVIGTRYHGFWGTVTEKPEGWSERSIAIFIDEWDKVVKLYRHNIFTELELEFGVRIPYDGNILYIK